MEHLRLEDDEEEIEIPEEELAREGVGFDPNLCLVGRFQTNKQVRTHMVKENMKNVWSVVKGVEVRQVKTGVFLFQFFNKHMMVLGAMAEGESPEDVALHTVPFWIQVHSLPVGYMAETVGRNVGNYVGEFLEYDEKNSLDFWRRYMRIRVMVDVRKPLVCTKSIKKRCN